MGRYKQYKLILKDLPAGKTVYEYDLDDSFFKLINDDESEVKKGKLKVAVSVTRTVAAFDVLFDINGVIHTPCDRCLDNVSLDVDTKQKLVVKFGAEYSEESDEIIIVPENEGEINVAWFIYEFIILCLPLKKVHAPGECNKVVSKKLKQHRSVSPDDDDADGDVDFDNADDMEMEEVDEGRNDSRWDTLKDFEID